MKKSQILLVAILMSSFSLKAQETKDFCPRDLIPQPFFAVDKVACGCCAPDNIKHIAYNSTNYRINEELKICQQFPVPPEWKSVGTEACTNCCGSTNGAFTIIRKYTGKPTSASPLPDDNQSGEKVISFIKTRDNRYSESNQAGGDGGSHFAFIPPPGTKRVRAIIFYSTGILEGLQMEWDMADGSIRSSPKVGTIRKQNEHVVDLANDEYITLIAGRSGKFIDNLMIRTNKRDIRFGGQGGGPFKLESDVCSESGVRIMGLVGKAGIFIDSIGAIGECIDK